MGTNNSLLKYTMFQSRIYYWLVTDKSDYTQCVKYVNRFFEKNVKKFQKLKTKMNVSFLRYMHKAVDIYGF